MRLIAIVLALSCATAHADEAADRSAAIALFADGQAKYEASDFDAAAALFARAYATFPDIAYLYNAAQAYRLGKQCVKARDAYRKFLEIAPNSGTADAAREYIRDLDPCANAESPPKKEVSVQVVPVPPPAPRVDAPSSHEPGRTKRRAGIATIAVGAIALAGGALFTARVGKHQRAADELCTPDDTGTCEWTNAKSVRLAEIDALGKRDQTLAIAGFVVGGAAIAGGVVLYMLGRSARAESVAIVPTTGGLTASFARSF